MIAPAGSLGDHFWNCQIRWQFGTWTSLVRSITTASGERETEVVLIVTLWKTRNTSSSKSTELKWSLMQKITVEMSPLNVRTHRTKGYDDTRVRQYYSGIFYSCQFIISFGPFHSFWEEEDLSRKSIQAFQNDTIIISWLFSFRVIYLTVQWHSFKTFMFVFITSSSSQKLFCQVPNQYRSLMTFRNKIQAETFTWPDMLFYAR